MKHVPKKTYKAADEFTARDLIEILQTLPPDTEIMLARRVMRVYGEGEDAFEGDDIETGYISEVETGAITLIACEEFGDPDDAAERRPVRWESEDESRARLRVQLDVTEDADVIQWVSGMGDSATRYVANLIRKDMAARKED